MENLEFDATLGGSEHLPYSANSFQFATSRSIEIAAMNESILHPNITKLIFQTLPVHMRRRVMSHNCKRLPRKLRDGHMEQLKKSGLPPSQKRPSRKYRRRPGNLLQEYNKRQRRCVWLETHIWHAKRFHMIERWGHKLAYAPCDKAFRACYRATSTHCLIQDLSYFTPIQIKGIVESIKSIFNLITDPSCGLSLCAKAFSTGKREGGLHIYQKNAFPFGYIGKVHFIWECSDSTEKSLWLFVHPSQIKEIEALVRDLASQLDSKMYEVPKKKRKCMSDNKKDVEIRVLSGIFNRFRLTGPNSHAVLVQSLKCIDSLETIKTNKWISSVIERNSQLYLKEKYEYWQKLCKASSPSQLPPSIVFGLVIRDPRLSRPSYRTKAVNTSDPLNTEDFLDVPSFASLSNMWDTNIHDIIKNNVMSNSQFIEHTTKQQLVPGEIYEEDPKLQSIPIVLIQRPGSQDADYKKLGYGSGWDIITPSGYGLPFWQLFIMFGARSGGLRESENLSFEMGECYLPPDSEAGKQNENYNELKLRERYFKLPPSKRVNYNKLAINSPFRCPWNILLKDWNNFPVNNFFILRDRNKLRNLKICVKKCMSLPDMNNSQSCLVAIYVHLEGKGSLKNQAHICIPQPGDIEAIKTLYEPCHEDPNAKLRKCKRLERRKEIKRLRRKRKKEKQLLNHSVRVKKIKTEPSEYVRSMRELWLPSTITNVRHLCFREVMGYVSQGAFSFSEAQCCGIGYVAYNALCSLLQSGQNKVLVRNTTTRKYRVANLQIINI